MMFADHTNRAGLWALYPYLLDEADLGPDRHTIEGVVEDTIAVEVNFPAIGSLNESTILTSEELYEFAMVLRVMRLDLATHFARGVLDLALRHSECIFNSDDHVLMFRCVAM